MKRILSLALCVVMLLSVLASCGDKTTTTTTTTPPVGNTCTSHVDTDGDFLCDNEGCGAVVRLEGEYTYNTYMSTFPTNWNPHTYEDATNGEMLSYELGFYTFDYNETMDGFEIVPELAAEMPIDVTADYVGEKWDIDEDETARAWKIVLRNDLRWEDGTPITANDFYESAKRLLDPTAINHRADSLYAGNLEIVGARNYFYGGRVMKDSATVIVTGADSEYSNVAGFSVNEDGQLYNGKGTLWFNVDDGCMWSTNALSKYNAYGYFAGSETVQAAWDALVASADDEGWVAVTADVADTLMLITAWLHVGGSVEDYAAKAGEYAYLEWNEFCYYGQLYEATSWDNVGIIVLSDTELVLVLTDPLEGFYLNYSLGTNLGLVHIPTYDANASVDENGIYTNKYGTSVETYKSYGPYKLTSFIKDKQIVFEMNDQWYGYTDPNYAGQYQTTRIVYDWIQNPDTAFEKFLQGELDSKGLEAKNINDYVGSEHLYYTDGASTWFVAMNPNESAFSEWESTHEGYDKSILTVKEFRMALSFSLNRQDFIKALDPMGSIGLALFNNMICSDPEAGIMYRTEEAAKDVILEFWGVSQDDIGPGELYADKDSAIASITGYNLDGAKALFNQAYDSAVAEGIYDGVETVQISIGLPGTATFYTEGFEFLKNCWTEAVKGTKLEGKLEFVSDNSEAVQSDFSGALHSNAIDMLFGVGWNGSALNPYGLIGAYTDPDYQYDPSWNTKTEMMDFVVDGVTYRASVYDWTMAIEGDKIEVSEIGADGQPTGETMNYSCGTADDKPEERILLLAALEGMVLRQYDMLPTHNQASASLLGMQVNYGTEEYVYGVGRGGIQYMTYNYTDAEWAEFVQSQGGILNYK